MSPLDRDRWLGRDDVVTYPVGLIRNILGHDWSAGVVRRLLAGGIRMRAEQGALVDRERWLDAERELDRVLDAITCPPKKFAAFGAEQRRAIARLTHELADRHRPASEIKNAVLVEAERMGLDPDAALGLAGAILKTKAPANAR